MYNDIINMRLN